MTSLENGPKPPYQPEKTKKGQILAETSKSLEIEKIAQQISVDARLAKQSINRLLLRKRNQLK